MAFDTYMKIQGIDGEATAKGMEKQVALQSFSWGASNPTNHNPGTTGLAASRVTVSSFSCLKQTDKTSAPLFLACCKGTHIPEIDVTMRKAAGDAGQAPFLVYKFKNCLVESVQWAGSSGGDDTPTESVSIAFDEVEITYSQQDTKGGAVGKPAVGAWNLATLDGK
ncbi:hypothetical protein tb265_17590 [Gemmatimonadetes bacterium T265]|nr:hypothetical protein tb265_17590 [Gemmatimonadetes bacterium T265]